MNTAAFGLGLTGAGVAYSGWLIGTGCPGWGTVLFALTAGILFVTVAILEDH